VRIDGDKYIVEAGAAHGITYGAEFAMYNTRDIHPTTEPLGNLKVITIEPFSTTVEVMSGSSFDLGTEVFALQTCAGQEVDLRLHVPLDGKLMSVFEALAEEMKQKGPAPMKIKFEEKKECAYLDIAFEDDHIVFNIMDPLVTVHGLNRLPYSVKPNVNDLYHIIRAAAHYHWHLRRTSSERILQKKVTIEFFQIRYVEGQYTDDLEPIIVRDGENLVRDNVVELIADEDVMYGVKILNHTTLDLYPSLFLFDNSDLSISKCIFVISSPECKVLRIIQRRTTNRPHPSKR
jgi:hypothetical protein